MNSRIVFLSSGYGEQNTPCREKSSGEEGLTDKELRQNIALIDKKRAKYYQDYTGRRWGDRLNYDLCVNTTQTVIKEMVPVLAKLFMQ